jgi:transcriptional regulator with GAF, ATPase, and Fis domain
LSPRLVAVSGPLAGTTFALGPAALHAGRDRANEIHLRDLAVSRRHCALEPTEDGCILLRDLDSRHGTFVNGVPVRERLLEEGDQITLGASLFLFQTRDESAAGEATAAGPAAAVLDDLGYTAESTVHLAPEDARYLRPDAFVEAPGSRVARDLQALLRIGNALHALRDSASLARRLLELVLETVPAERTALLLLDRGGEMENAFALDRGGAAETFPISRTLVQRAIAERSAILANDVLQAPGWSGAESLFAARIQSLIAVPLTGPEGALGLLYLDSPQAGVRFDEAHLELLTAAGGIAAAALANIRHLEGLRDENLRIEAALSHEMVGESPRMREVYRFLGRVAPTDSTVLLRGESGTGKELAARALHHGSPRSGKPFVAINCAALSETLLESELFGHEKGAFTGALSRKLGKLEVAHTGTVFLDEIGELSPTLQAKLLRALQEREIERVGGTRPIRVDLRVVAATNRDLEKAMREGAFREDLFYRLNVITVTLPPLRERREDIPLLASHFAALICRKLGRRAAGFTPEARACLLRYPWPGNVRELANAVERAAVLGEGDLIRPEDLPETLLEAAPAAGGGAVTPYHETLNRTKRQLILDAVRQAGGNVTRAAEALGLHPNYLHRLISNLGLRDQIND